MILNKYENTFSSEFRFKILGELKGFFADAGNIGMFTIT
jgi:hypothetical protein